MGEGDAMTSPAEQDWCMPYGSVSGVTWSDECQDCIRRCSRCESVYRVEPCRNEPLLKWSRLHLRDREYTADEADQLPVPLTFLDRAGCELGDHIDNQVIALYAQMISDTQAKP